MHEIIYLAAVKSEFLDLDWKYGLRPGPTQGVLSKMHVSGRFERFAPLYVYFPLSKGMTYSSHLVLLLHNKT